MKKGMTGKLGNMDSSKLASGMVSPRKRMGGTPTSGNFGVTNHAMAHKGMPSMNKGMGTKGHMGDGERGIGMPVARGKGMMPAQAHPSHGGHGYKG